MALFRSISPRSLVSRFSGKSSINHCVKSFANEAGANESRGGKKGLVLGVYSDEEETEHKLTGAAEAFNEQSGGKLEDLLRQGMHLTRGKGTVFQNLDSEFFAVSVVGLGKEDLGYNPLEQLDECKENIRVAAAVGARKLKAIGMTQIFCEGFGHAESAAEGAGLAIWRYQGQRENKKPSPRLELYHDEDQAGWMRGMFKADAQNLARRLTDTPANLMTPAIFAKNAVDILCPCGVTVDVRDRDWLEDKKMHAFLAVARGSCEPPIFLEMSYCGGPPAMKPIALVGKGITFDAGGLNLKQCDGMHEYRGDMTGAAVIVAVMQAVASLGLPINVKAVIPLCENMPSGMAMRPGDVVHAMDGQTISVDDTDNEGRLILADALVFTTRFLKPRITIDVGSLTAGMRAALGSGATGVYSNNHDLWDQIQKAGAVTGDRMWRFPLWNHFTKKVVEITNADVTNVGHGAGSPCKAAAFLQEFVPCGDWLHLDTTGAGMLANAIDYPYLSVGKMTGRPTRTLIQLLYQLACPQASVDCVP